MNIRALLPALLLLTPTLCPAAMPVPERLLPADTLGILTVPDWDRAMAFYRSAAMSQLWNAPEMKGFREKFEARWKEEFSGPTERDLGIKLEDFGELIHGQVTLGFLPSITDKNTQGGLVLIADSREKKDALARKLAAIKKKWLEAGKEQRTENVRGVEFTVYLWTPTNKPAASAGGRGNDDEDLRSQAGAKSRKNSLCIGQAESLLLAGTNPADFERIIGGLNGGLSSPLAEVPEFERHAATLFHKAQVSGWVNARALNNLLLKTMDSEKKSGQPANPFAPSPERVIEALGLASLQTLGLRVGETDGGTSINIFIGAPESGRKGLFKILSTEAKDASPPPFVPADVTKFTRWRSDGRKLWATLETLLNDISPALSGALQMGLDSLGKEKDPNFNLKESLIGNLGDDLISYQKAPRSSKLADLNSPPAIYLIGSPQPEKLLLAFKTGIGLMPVRPDSLTDRELLGRKVYRVKMAPVRNPEGPGFIERTLSFTHGNGYMAVSTDEGIIEEFLRSSDSPPRGLRETAGLAEAAQHTGGMGTGWFGYENQTESMRALFDAAKKDPALAEKLFSGGTLGTVNSISGFAGVPQAGASAPGKSMKDWLDFSLLPPFAQVAKYFHFTVNAVSARADGIHFQTFLPTPPQLKK